MANHARLGQSDYVEMVDQQRRHDDAMDCQEAALEEIRLGAKELTHLAHTINHEVVKSTQLVGDIGQRMDRTQRDLERGEAQARVVNAQKGKVCKLYAVIILLIVAELVMTMCGIPFFDF